MNIHPGTRVRTLHGGKTGTVIARYEERQVSASHRIHQPEFEIKFDEGFVSRISVRSVEAI